jgi:hypothetical protein
LSVAVADHSLTVAGAENLGSGPVRLRFSGVELSHPHTVAVIELKPGASPEDLRQAPDDAGGAAGPSRSAGRLILENEAMVEKYGRIVAGGEVSAAADHVTTITARARDFVVADVTTENGRNATFTVDERASGARLPRSNATIGLRDTGFALSSPLPGQGVIRIANQGDRPHQVTAYRLKRTVSYAEAKRAAIKGRVLNGYGASTVLTGIVSPGTVNRVEVALRPGRYLVISHYAPLKLGAWDDVLHGLVSFARVR